jgi:hypothetical protein
MGGKTGLAPVVKQSIVADRVSGMKIKDIAKKHGLHRITVGKVIKQFKRDAPASMLANPVGDYKERLKGKAIGAVENGLECPVDPYKRGGLGVQVLKGIGEFENERPLVGVVINIEGSRLASRYRNLEVKPEMEEVNNSNENDEEK